MKSFKSYVNQFADIDTDVGDQIKQKCSKRDSRDIKPDPSKSQGVAQIKSSDLKKIVMDSTIKMLIKDARYSRQQIYNYLHSNNRKTPSPEERRVLTRSVGKSREKDSQMLVDEDPQKVAHKSPVKANENKQKTHKINFKQLAESTRSKSEGKTDYISKTANMSAHAKKDEKYVNKSQFLLKKKFQFKNKKNEKSPKAKRQQSAVPNAKTNLSVSKSKSPLKSNTKTKKTNLSASKSKSPLKSNTKTKKTNLSASKSKSPLKSNTKTKKPARKFKEEHTVIKSKVKRLLKSQDKDLEERKNRSNTVDDDNDPDNNEKRKRKSQKAPSHIFVKSDNLKAYSEKNLVKPINIRKFKINRGKQFLNMQKKMLKNTGKDKYMGKGQFGLDDIDILKHEAESVEVLVQGEAKAILTDIQQKMPCFSEGYYNSNVETILENLDNNNINNIGDLKSNDMSTLKPAKADMTPGRLLTKTLNTAVKSSIRRQVPLDTELKILSQEFRYLLSGKKLEAEKILKMKQESIEKKLNFTNENSNTGTLMQIEEEKDSGNMTDEEVEQLENDILLKVLDENFGYKQFLPGQLSTIKNVLNCKRTMTILPPGCGKSLCFQLPSLVMDGLTIVISPLLSSITDQIMNLPPNLSGASLSSFTSHNQRNEIFDAIKQKKIKILFITPERFSIENFSDVDEISLICFEDASCASPLTQNFRASYISADNIIKKLHPGSLLLLASSITQTIENNLKTLYSVEVIVKEPISLCDNINISVSKEENKLTALVKLIRSNSYKYIGPTIIFCNLKKTVDKVTSFLNQNGISASSYHSGKEDLDRQMVHTNFMKDKIKCIVCTMAFSLGVNKKDVRLVVVYDIPPSLEHLLQQIGRCGRDKKEAYAHIFLNDEDFFIQRNMIYAENLDKSQILKFIEYMHSMVLPNKESTRIKRTFNESLNSGFSYSSLLNSSSESISLPKTVSLTFSTVTDITDIKKQMQLYLLTTLIQNSTLNVTSIDQQSSNSQQGNNNTSINLLGIGPTEIKIRFYKTTPEKLREIEPNINLILESSQEIMGSYKFNTTEACEKIGITYTDLINYLYHLQAKGEIAYESKEEGVFLVIKKIPDSFMDIMLYLLKTNQYLINLNLRKLNASYVLMRKFATNSHETFSTIATGKAFPVKCLTSYQSYAQYNADFKKCFIEYFACDDDIVDVQMAGSESELNILIPICTIETKRDKAIAWKEIEGMVNKEIEKDINMNPVDVINILFGISRENKAHFSNPLWGKYKNYQYTTILEMIESILFKAKSYLLSKNSNSQSKKKKI